MCHARPVIAERKSAKLLAAPRLQSPVPDEAIRDRRDELLIPQ
jgi:hypothetical protein